MQTFSPQQVQAALQIANEGIHRYAILIAQMQSGKSMAFWLGAALYMYNNPTIDKIISISGVSDLGLRNQAQDSNATQFARIFRRWFRRYLRDVDGKTADEADEIEEEFWAKFSRSIEYIWGPDLDKPYAQITNAIIVWDESHSAQDKAMRVDKFFIKHGIPANGDLGRLQRHNLFVISISATPFSEVCDLIHKNQSKVLVNLQPGDGYMGVRDMLDMGLIESFTNPAERLELELIRLKTGDPKYAIVRVATHGHNLQLPQVRDLVDEIGGIVLQVYDSSEDSTTEDLSFLETAPDAPTLIVVKGKCRMGQNVHKAHISFVMETTKDPNADTILQGLLGRMCGYDNPGNIRVILYQKILERGDIHKFTNSTPEQPLIPGKAKNIVTPSKELEEVTNNLVERRPMNPICQPQFRISDEEWRDYKERSFRQEGKDVVRMSVIESLRQGTGINTNAPNQTEEIIERMTTMDWSNIHVRKIEFRDGQFTNQSHPDLLAKLHDHVVHNKAGRLGSSNGIQAGSPTIVLWTIMTDFPEYGFHEGDVFLDARTIAVDPDKFDQLLRDNEIPRTTGNELFCRELEDGDVVVENGGYTIGLAVETCMNVEMMQNALAELIGLSLVPSEYTVRQRKVTSNMDAATNEWKGILVTEEVLKAIQPRGSAFRQLRTQFGVELKVQRVRGTRPAGLRMVRVTSISW